MEEKISIKKLEELKEGIEELMSVKDWTDFKIKSSAGKFNKRFERLFLDKIGILPIIILLADTNVFPLKFYRLRKLTKNMNETLISEYSYPPNYMVKSVQRANLPYHPVFYCSDDPLTAIYETLCKQKLNENNIYYLSEWELRTNESLKITPFVFGNLTETNPYRNLSNICKTKIENIFKGYSQEEIQSIDKTLEFLSTLFIYDNTYIVSSYIAHYHLYAGHNYRPDIFIYPSFQTKRKTVNFAIHPNSVSEKLLLKQVFKLRVVEIDKEKESVNVRISYRGKNEDGIIYWQDIDSTTEAGKSMMAEIDKNLNRV